MQQSEARNAAPMAPSEAQRPCRCAGATAAPSGELGMEVTMSGMLEYPAQGHSEALQRLLALTSLDPAEHAGRHVSLD